MDKHMEDLIFPESCAQFLCDCSFNLNTEVGTADFADSSHLRNLRLILLPFLGSMVCTTRSSFQAPLFPWHFPAVDSFPDRERGGFPLIDQFLGSRDHFLAPGKQFLGSRSCLLAPANWVLDSRSCMFARVKWLPDSRSSLQALAKLFLESRSSVSGLAKFFLVSRSSLFALDSGTRLPSSWGLRFPLRLPPPRRSRRGGAVATPTARRSVPLTPRGRSQGLRLPQFWEEPRLR